jgi:hypothetical protein
MSKPWTPKGAIANTLAVTMVWVAYIAVLAMILWGLLAAFPLPLWDLSRHN